MTRTEERRDKRTARMACADPSCSRSLSAVSPVVLFVRLLALLQATWHPLCSACALCPSSSRHSLRTNHTRLAHAIATVRNRQSEEAAHRSWSATEIKTSF